jgi:hypothetical protein
MKSVSFARGLLFCGLTGTLVSVASVAHAASTTLTITGSPQTTVALGQTYSFQPVGTDTVPSRLKYSISNLPSWATFDENTGKLTGRPAGHVVGTYSGILIRLTDWYGYVTLPYFSITVTAAPATSTGGTSGTGASAPASTNKAPAISGSPVKSVTVGSAYTFKPTASDANGDTLKFSILNKPSWATFSTTTGALTGTPTAAAVGTYANIGISVSDGKTSVALPAFAVTVSQIATGNVTLDWSPTTENVDGSVLTNLAGYRLHYGTSATSLTHTVQIASAGVTNYVVENLSAGTWYFAVTSYSSAGVESALSGVLSSPVL